MANKQIRYGIGFDVDKTELNNLKSELTKIQQMSVKEFKIATGSTDSIGQLQKKLESVQSTAKLTEKALQESFNPKLNTINIDTFNQKIQSIPGGLVSIQQSFSTLGERGQNAFKKLYTSVNQSNLALKESYSLLDQLGQTFTNTIKWSIASGAINTVTSSIQKAWNYSIKLDKSLNDIRIVTDKSADNMEKFAKKANNAAKALGAATTAYTKASLIYYQQGLSEEDVQARTDVTIKAANVTGQSAAEVSEQLTAVWNGYKVVAEDAERYVDKLSAVAAKTAADLEELSEGMSKVASGANAMGVDIDQLTAQLSTIVSVTRQDASSVGTALKTIFARMGDLKVDGVDEFGVSLGEVSGTLKQVGIEVLDQEGNLRNMGTVMEEVAAKWGTWTEAQQQAIAVAMAGKRQYNNLLALFENWDMYESALTTSRGSEGTLQKQQDIYMESLEARLQRISTAGERVYDAFFDSDSMKDLIDGVAVAVDKVGELIELFGGGGNVLLMFGGIAGRVFGKQISSLLNTAIQRVQAYRYNMSQLAAQEQVQEAFRSANIKDGKIINEDLEKLISIKEKQLKLEHALTEEQKARNREAFTEIVKATEASIDANVAFSEANDAYLALQGTDKKDTEGSVRKRIDFEKSGIHDKSGDDLELEDRLVSAQEKFKQEQEQLNKISEKNKKEAGKFADEVKKQEQKVQEVKEELASVEKIVALARSDENRVSAEDAIKHTKEISDYSSRLAGQVGNVAQNAEIAANYQRREEEYKNKYGLNKDQKIDFDKSFSEIDTKLADKSISKKGKTDLIKQKKDLEALKKEQKEYNKAIKELGTQSAKNPYKKIRESLTDLTTGQNKNNKVTQDASNKIVDLNKNHKNLSKILSKLGKQDVELTTEEFEELTEALGEYNVILKQSEQTSAEAGVQIAKTNEEALKNQEEVAKKEAEEAEERRKQINQAGVQGLVEIAGAAMQIYGSAKAAAESLSSIWSDENLSGSEKFMKSIEALLPIVLGLIPTFAGLGKSIKSLIPSFTGAGAAGGASGAATSAAWAPVTLVILAVVVAVVALIAIFMVVLNILDNVNDKGKKAFQAAADAAKSATEEAEKTREAYEKLKKSFEEYDKAQDAIDEMTRGTQEWKDAIQEANLQVLDLIDAYPQLAEEVSNVNGRLLISEQGKEAVLETQENAVAIANANKLSANANKLDAKNKMLKQQGADSALDTSSAGEAGAVLTGVLTALGLGMGGIIGASLLGGIGYLITSEIAKATALPKQTAYDAAIDIINEEGNHILADREAFTKAMQERGIVDKNLINRLYDLGDDLAENAAAIKANTEALKIQQQQAAAQYLLANSITFQNSKNQEAISKVIGKVANSDSQEYKNKYAYYGSKHNIYEAATEYAKLNNIQHESVRLEGNALVYKMADGSERTVNYETARIALASQAALAAASSEQSVKDIENAINAIGSSNKIGQSTERKDAIFMALSGLVAGETSADFSGMTETELQNFTKITDVASAANALGISSEALKENAITLGYETGEDYVKALQKSVENYKKDLMALTDEMVPVVREAFAKLTTEADFKNFTLATKKAIANSLNTAFKENGSIASNALKDLYSYAAGQLSKEDMATLVSVVNNIDWSSQFAIQDFKNQLDKMGIALDQNAESWKNFISNIEKARNAVNELINNFSSVDAKVVQFKEIVTGLAVGAVISEEDYKILTGVNAAYKNYFIKAPGGYSYIGGAEKLFTESMKNIIDPKQVEQDFSAAKTIGENIINNQNSPFNSKATTEEGKIGELQKVIAADTDGKFFAAMGLNKEDIKDAINTVQNGGKAVDAEFFEMAGATNLNVEGKNDEQKSYLRLIKGLTPAKIANMKTEDLAEYITGSGITLPDGLSAAEYAQRLQTNAKATINSAQDIINNAFSGATTQLENIEDGTFDQEKTNNIAYSLMATTDSREKLKAEYGGTSVAGTDAYQQALQGFLNLEREQYEVDEFLWSKMNIEQQEAYIDNIKKIQSLDEVNYLKNLEKEINKTTKELDALRNKQKNLSGQDLLDNLDQQIQKEKELAQLEQNRFEKNQSRWSIQKINFESEGNKAALTEIGITNLGEMFNSDGTVNSDFYDTLLTTYKESALTEEQQTFLKKFLQELDAYDNEVVSGLDNVAEAEFESASNQADLLFEKFNATYQIHIDLSEAKLQLEEFKKKLNFTIIEDKENKTKTPKISFEELSGKQVADYAKNSYGEYLSQYKTYIQKLTAAGVTVNENGEYVLPDDYKTNGELKSIIDEAIESAQGSIENAYGAVKEMLEAYSSIQEEVIALYDEQINKIENINSLYSTSVNLLKLIGGNTAKYATQIKEYLNTTQENLVKSQAVALEQLDAAKLAYKNDYATATEEQKKLLEENLNSAANAVLNTSNQLAESTAAVFENGFKSAIDAAFNDAENKFGLTGFSEAWERDLYFDERYLDETNRAYQLADLERKINKSIESTDSYSAQKKLNELKQKELDILSKKDKLTQDDLDRANARYELELKRIALEEAQQTASKMKLVRDASGNYTYQYVADEDAVAEAQEEYDKAQNDLYNLTKDQEKNTISDLISKYQEASEAIGSAQTAEEKDILYDYYFGENGVISLLKKDLAAIGEDTEGYASPYEKTIEKLMNIDSGGIAEQFDSLLNGEDGFKASMESLEATINNVFDEGGALITAIDSLSSNIVKLPEEGKTIFDYVNMTGSATDILDEVFGKGGIAKLLGTNANNIVALLTTKIGATGIDTNTEAVIDNTKATRDLTQALLLSQDLLDGKYDGQVEGWKINDTTGLYEQSIGTQ